MSHYPAKPAQGVRTVGKWAGLLGWVVLGVVSGSGAHASGDGDVPGVLWTGAPGIVETVSAIMARGTGGLSATRAASVRPALRPDRSQLPSNPLSPESPTAGLVSASAMPLATLPAGMSFLGAQLSDTIGYYPPDSMGDVGPSQIVVAVNGRIRSFGRNGVADGALNLDPDVFFASVLSASTSDPRVRYDRLSRRWFLTMIDTATPNRILIAVSSGPQISSSSSFTFFQFQHDLVGTTPNSDTGGFADYDTLGVDANALYIGINVFNASGTSYLGTTGYVVNKANLLAGTLTVTAFRQMATASGSGPYTPQGVNNDDPSATNGYFIGTDNASTGLLTMRRINNPGGVPSISANIPLTVPSTAAPINPTVLGSSSPLDGLDDRLYATRMHRGSLWTAHHIQVGSSGTANRRGKRDGARWYQIANLTGSPVLVQSGTLFDSAASSPRSYWMPSCAANGQGHLVLGCSVAGATEHADIAVASRLATDAAGTLQSPTTVVASAFTYNAGLQNGTYRWGDYSVTTVDPNDDMTFWTFQEYCNGTDSWGVRVIQVMAPPPATPVACSPAVVPQGASNVTLSLIGAVTNGSGFFDPGPGFTNRLTAAVGPGVVVNGIAFNSATNLTLTITVLPAAPVGPRTVTVTNPDGQSAASAAGLLTVLTNFTLSVANAGSGNGTVTSLPAGISGEGTARYPSNTLVTLTAAPDATSTFVGWGGGAAGTNTQTTVVMNGDRAVTALFARITYTLTLERTGSGRVVSVPAGIDCGTNCSASFVTGTVVTLTATPDPHWVFDAWGGAASGSNTSVDVILSSDTTVSAAFVAVALPPPSILSIAGSGPAIQLGFTTVSDGVYDVEAGTDLVAGSWGVLTSNIVGTGTSNTVVDPDAGLYPLRFYRIRLLP